MKFASTTPETVCSTYRQVEDVDEFIRNLKREHPNLRLTKADLYCLSWNKEGYVNSRYIVLKNVSQSDLNTIRKILTPEIGEYFEVKKNNIRIVGYFNPKTSEILIQNDDGRLETINKDIEYLDDGKNKLYSSLWQRRTNLRYVLKHKGLRGFYFGELIGWGKIDPIIDIKKILKDNGFLVSDIIYDKEEHHLKYGESFEAITREEYVNVICNGLHMRVKRIEEDFGNILFLYDGVETSIKDTQIKTLHFN